jgi:hypothetical protein
VLLLLLRAAVAAALADDTCRVSARVQEIRFVCAGVCVRDAAGGFGSNNLLRPSVALYGLWGRVASLTVCCSVFHHQSGHLMGVSLATGCVVGPEHGVHAQFVQP